MSDYSLKLSDKEQWKLQFSDLSPSLQAVLNSKVDKSVLDDLEKRIEAYKKFINGMVLTIGTTFPSNPTNNKNVFLNSSNRVLYIYTASTWRAVTMIPQK